MGATQNTEGRDLAEVAAFLYLKKRFGTDPVYEPNGRATFPDFLVDQDVICEVTTVDTLLEKDGGLVQARNIYWPILDALKRDLGAHAAKHPFTGARNYYITFDFFEGVDKRVAQSAFREWLKCFWKTPEEVTRFELCESVSLDVLRGSKTPKPSVTVGGYSGEGGWSFPDSATSIKEALKVKAKALHKVHGFYSRAILIVAAGPALLVRESQLEELRAEIGENFGWSEVVVLRSENAKPLSLKLD